MVNRKLIFCLLLLLANFQIGCKKLVDIKAPITSINQSNVYNDDGTAIAVLTGIYADMASGSQTAGFSGNQSLSILAGLSSDELTLYNGVSSEKYIAYYHNSLAPNPNPLQDFGSEHWTPIYNWVFTCNAAIEGLNTSNSLTPAVKTQLLGEAKFMRAFFYFYLINLYGDVPLALTTDYTINSKLSRTPKTDIYRQIISDLKEAEDLLNSGYLDNKLQLYSGSEERVRPTKWAAAALLARVFLYAEDWTNAETQATIVIDNGTLFALGTLDNAFLKNNREAIWQLQPVRGGHNTEDALSFIMRSTGPSDDNPVYLSDQLLNSFEVNDQRRSKWVDSIIVSPATYYFPFKYKINTLNDPVSEYLMVLRLSEQYLIRAEARAQLNNISGCESDLNAIRNRAGLANTTVNDTPSLLTAILHERQVELFTELGHRWFDLKRTGNIDAVMNSVTLEKGGTWQSYQQLYPILYSDLQKNPNLTQNPGY
jgi:hypothetical protein